MRISDRSGLTKEAIEFIESLELRVEGNTLVVEQAGLDEDPILDVLVSEGSADPSELELLGITSWTYIDSTGVTISPPDRGPANEDNPIVQAFESSYGRRPTKDEFEVMSAELGKAVSSSSEIRAWANNIDFEALHAFDLVSRDLCSGNEISPRAIFDIAKSDIAAQSVRRFILVHPILAGFAWNGPALFEVAEKGKTVDEGYARVVEYVQKVGFPANNDANWDEPVGPIPETLLGTLRGLKIDIASNLSIDETMWGAGQAFKLARRLPPEFFPKDRDGYLNLVMAGRFIGRLEGASDDLGAPYEEGYDFGLNFSENELAALFADAGKVSFAGLPDGLAEGLWYRSLGAYGVALAGFGDWMKKKINDDAEEDLPAGFEGYSALKEALMSEGITRVLKGAQDFYRGIEQEIAEANVSTSAP